MLHRQCVLFFLTLVLGLGLSSFGQAQSREQNLLNNLPQQYNRYQAEPIVYYGTAHNGYSRKYGESNSVKITVYLFNAGQKYIGDGVSDPTVISEFQDARAAIGEAVKMGLYSNLRPLKQYGVTVPRALKGKGSLPFLVSSYSYQVPNNPQTVYSRLYVTGLHNLVFKVRVTQSKSAQPSEAEMQQFLAMAVDSFDKAMMK